MENSIWKSNGLLTVMPGAFFSIQYQELFSRNNLGLGRSDGEEQYLASNFYELLTFEVVNSLKEI